MPDPNSDPQGKLRRMFLGLAAERDTTWMLMGSEPDREMADRLRRRARRMLPFCEEEAYG